MSIFWQSDPLASNALQFHSFQSKCQLQLSTPSQTGHWGVDAAGHFFQLGSNVPLRLSSNTVLLPEDTAFHVGDRLHIQTDGRFHLHGTSLDLRVSNIALPEQSQLQMGPQLQISSQHVQIAVPHVYIKAPQLRLEGTTQLDHAQASELHASIHVQTPTVRCDELKVTEADLKTRLTLGPGACLVGSNASCSWTQYDAQGQETTLTFQKGIVSVGHVHLSSSNLTLSDPSTHAAFHGALTVNGPTQLQGAVCFSHPTSSHRIVGPLECEGGAQVHRRLTIGQSYQPAECWVYGTTRLHQHLYAHGRSFFDQPVLIHGQDRDQTVLQLSKGSLDLNDGHLNVKGKLRVHKDVSLDQTCVIQKDTTLQGNLSVHLNAQFHSNVDIAQTLVVQRSIQGGRDLELKGNLTAGGQVSIANDLHTGGRLHVGGDVQMAARLQVSGDIQTDGQLKTGGHLYCGQSLTVQNDLRAEGHLFLRGNASCQDLRVDGQATVRDTFHHRFRHYSLYEPLQTRTRVFQFLRAPPHRLLSLRLRGHFFTSQSSKRFQIDLAGTMASPTVQEASVSGYLHTAKLPNADRFATIWFGYESKGTEAPTLLGFLEVKDRIDVGFELDIECGAESTDSIWEPVPALPFDRWNVWWKPLDAPRRVSQSEHLTWMTRVGIGETQPLYALDVRSDARFQSKLYQPFPADLLSKTPLPTITHRGQTYAALTDLLEYLMQKIDS